MSDLVLSPEERLIMDKVLATGELDLLTNFYMQLPNSGSMWMPDDAIGHYRHLFGYEFLFDAWTQAGKPDEFDVLTAEYQYHIRTVWDGTTPNFLYPHGYLFLPWVKPVISRDNHLALVITGTSSAKCLPARTLADLCDGSRQRIVDLKVGDRFRLPRRIPESNAVQTVSDNELKVLGYLLGDGGLTRCSVIFTNVNERILHDFKKPSKVWMHILRSGSPTRRTEHFRIGSSIFNGMEMRAGSYSNAYVTDAAQSNSLFEFRLS